MTADGEGLAPDKAVRPHQPGGISISEPRHLDWPTAYFGGRRECDAAERRIERIELAGCWQSHKRGRPRKRDVRS